MPFPNLGPKVNHNFQLNNSFFTQIEHPRWGVIQSVTANRDIEAGEEVFTHYGYKEGSKFPGDFPWFFEAKRKLEREKENRQEENDNNKV